MLFDLTESERRILEQALTGELAELRIQIAVTEGVDRRDLLRRRRKVISKVLDTLRASPARPSSSGVRRTGTVRQRAGAQSFGPGAHVRD